MSTEAYPIIFINLSSEMIYIVEQRLTAQNIDKYKAHRVINDIFTAIFNPQFMSYVFKRQPLITLQFMRGLFEKIAHTSIMKLNEQSMNKLFDLMAMVMKYQIVSANSPNHLIDITLNHLNSLCKISKSEQTIEFLTKTKAQFMCYYEKFNLAQLQHIRYTVLLFFQDIRTKVLVLIREGKQWTDGKFVIKPEGLLPPDCQIPGLIKYFNENNEIKYCVNFESGGVYSVSNEKTSLGLNIYAKENVPKCDKQSNDEKIENVEQVKHVSDIKEIRSDSKQCPEISDSGKQESYLLGKLIGRQEQIASQPELMFWFNLESDESVINNSVKDKITHKNEFKLNETIHESKDLALIINDLNIDSYVDMNTKTSSNDLLDMMDSQ